MAFLATELGLETGSLETPSSSGESANFRFLQRVARKAVPMITVGSGTGMVMAMRVVCRIRSPCPHAGAGGARSWAINITISWNIRRQKCALIKAKSPVPARCGRATRYFGCHRVGCDRISLRRASMSPKIMPNSSEIRGMSVYTEHYHFTSCLQPDGTWKIA